MDDMELELAILTVVDLWWPIKRQLLWRQERIREGEREEARVW